MVSLHVLFARAAPRGVVFRLGPGRRAQLIAWETERYRFIAGPVLRGGLHPRLSDLSPDGGQLVYFVRGVSSTSARSAARRFPYAWTAISRPPHFTPLALWTQE